MLEIRHVEGVAELPAAWDSLAQEYFQTREFLAHCEAENPCRQNYILALKMGDEGDLGLVGGAVCYRLKIDILAFLKIPSAFKLKICGIPCSVSASGLLGTAEGQEACGAAFMGKKSGLKLFLNLYHNPEEVQGPEELFMKGLISGPTFPSVCIDQPPPSWEAYIKALRSPYRRWLKTILEKASPLRHAEGDCSRFTGRHYQLYRQVLARSDGKLETLGISFFQRLPSRFRLESLYSGDELVAWSIFLNWKDRFYFFLTGLEYKRLGEFDSYFALLASLVKRGIESGAARIELGQTTEWAKCRFGARLDGRWMAGAHPNPLVNGILKLGRPLLAYRGKSPNFRVFKEKP